MASVPSQYMAIGDTTAKTNRLGGPRDRIMRIALSGFLLAAFGLFIWSRFWGLDLSLWNDEVYTVVNYVDPGPVGIFFGSYVPNDHALFVFYVVDFFHSERPKWASAGGASCRPPSRQSL